MYLAFGIYNFKNMYVKDAWFLEIFPDLTVLSDKK